MILGFHERFVPSILAGTKTHTIREGTRWRVGMRADLYSGVRTKKMELLFRAPVVKVETLELFVPDGYSRGSISIDGEVLDKNEMQLFTLRDGFDGVEGFWRWWSVRMPVNVVKTLQLIHWDLGARWGDPVIGSLLPIDAVGTTRLRGAVERTIEARYTDGSLRCRERVSRTKHRDARERVITVTSDEWRRWVGVL